MSRKSPLPTETNRYPNAEYTVNNQRLDARISHYDWLNAHWEEVVLAVGGDPNHQLLHRGLISAHGDKVWCCQSEWEEAGIPFHHGVALYLMGRTHVFRGVGFDAKDVMGNTPTGYVSPGDWVVATYPQFKSALSVIPATI